MDRYLPQNPRLRAAIGYVAAFALTLLFTQLILPGKPGGGRGTPFAILFQGLCAGFANALPAVGMILLFRTLRIINFAQTAIGVAGAVLVWEFTQFTEVPFPVALIIGMVVAGAIGAAVGVVTLRFFNSSRLFLTVITILLTQVLANVSSQVRNLPFFPPLDQRTDAERGLLNDPRQLMPLRGFEFHIGDLGIDFGFAELFTLEFGLLALLAVGFFLQRTKSGVAVRALAENSERASLLGIGVGKLSIMVWAIAGALSGIGVTMYGSITTVNNATSVDITVLIGVLAAAVLARFTSIPVAVVAASLIGVADQAWDYSFDQHEGVFDAILFGIVAVGLLTQRRRGRSEAGQAVSWSVAAAYIVPTGCARSPQERQPGEYRCHHR
jgi:branched-subunit amino acid ABC-type transport system permease component